MRKLRDRANRANRINRTNKINKTNKIKMFIAADNIRTKKFF